MNPSENTKGPEILKWDCKRFPGKGVESTEVPLESPSSRYRYWIERSWNDNPDFILWIMFNPSHATIKCNRTISGRDGAVPICFGRSQRIAHYQDLSVGGMRIVNLFARRATDIHASEWPKGKPYDHPLWDAWIGPGDLNHIRDQAKAAKRVIAAWGFDKVKNEGAKWWADSIEAELSDLWCLRHPAGKSHPSMLVPKENLLSMPTSFAWKMLGDERSHEPAPCQRREPRPGEWRSRRARSRQSHHESSWYRETFRSPEV